MAIEDNSTIGTDTPETATSASPGVPEQPVKDVSATPATSVPATPATKVTPATKAPGKPAKDVSEKRRRRSLRLTLIASLSTLFALVVAGIGYSMYVVSYYDDHVKPGTTLSGRDVSGMTESEVEQTIAAITDGAKIPVTYQGTTVSATLQDLGITYDADSTVGQIMQAGATDSLLRRYDANVAKPVQLSFSTDPVKLQQWLDATFIPDQTPVVDATAAFDNGTDQWTATPSTAHTEILPGPVTTILQSGRLDPANPPGVSVTSTTQEPKLSTAVVQAAVDKANKILDAEISVTNGDKGTYTITRDQLKRWVSVKTSAAAGTATVVVDKQAMLTELPDELTKALNVDMVPRTLLTDQGVQVAVQQAGSDGLKLTDVTAVIGQIYDAVVAGTSTTITATMETIPMTTEAVAVVHPNDGQTCSISDEKWIDINLTSHTLTAYQGACVVFGPTKIVDGMKGWESDVGSFHIYMKLLSQTMTGGSKANGTYYSTPNVPWISYYNGGEAIHGAYWRSTFGYQGSHGCINMQVSQAKWIYEWAPIGTRVEVHY